MRKKSLIHFSIMIFCFLLGFCSNLRVNNVTSLQITADLEQKNSSNPQLSKTLAWDDDGIIICNTFDIQNNPQVCRDEAGGAIITWSDERNGAWDENIYAQKIDSAGNPQWGDGSIWGGNPDRNGTVICNALFIQDNPQICRDGNGGAIIIWQDTRGPSYDIYAQRIDSAGNTQWGDGSIWGGNPDRNGTVICNAINNQLYLQICCYSAGGAIITWQDYRNSGITDSDIYAQWIDSAGNTQWGDGTIWGGNPDRNGTIICNAIDYQFTPQICIDGAGGAIITWQDYRSSSEDIYAQQINSAGNPQWGENGIVICNATSYQGQIQICRDDTGGAIIIWTDFRGGSYNIYAQNVNSTGITQWGDGSTWGGNPDRNGTVICNAMDVQINPQVCIDGVGGAIITWKDKRDDLMGDIYAQNVNSTGTRQWGDGSTWGGNPDRNGTVISNAIDAQWDPKICSDGAIGAFITWKDQRSYSTSAIDIYAQNVNSSGNTLLGDGSTWGGNPDRNGTAICNAIDAQLFSQICSDGAGGAIITWQDNRTGYKDIYAQLILSTYQSLIPNVSILCPTPGIYGTSSLLINASITDAYSTISSVKAMINATIPFNISMNPLGMYWICTWGNISSYASSDYKIRIWAIDNVGIVNQTEFVVITIEKNRFPFLSVEDDDDSPKNEASAFLNLIIILAILTTIVLTIIPIYIIKSKIRKKKQKQYNGFKTIKT